tara:strand:- start:19813 stop:20277 length:465 start_codon:yes stop_codon:yes gene_type:complete
MINIFKNTILLLLLTSLVACGYTPLLNKQKINFYINELNVEGDRQVNNIISKKLEKYLNFAENKLRYDLKVETYYKKEIVNKDKSGNPKNYNVLVETKIILLKENGDQAKKSFKRSISLTSQDKKIEEKRLENTYKEDLSKLISNDIIFFISNQ